QQDAVVSNKIWCFCLAECPNSSTEDRGIRNTT
ncbi:MAG: hypothetical protein ACI9Y1_001687, partial [Lentisphaeria bacterium]